MLYNKQQYSERIPLTMSDIKKAVLIVGSTGLVGGFLLNELLDSPHFEKIIALTRKEIPFSHPKLQCIVSDFKDLDRDLEKIRAYYVFCCLGTTIKKAGNKTAFRHIDFDLPVQIAHLMHRSGSDYFSVISALGADANSRIFYNQVKGQLEQSVLAVGYRYTTILRPSLLMGDRPVKRLGESLSLKATAMVSPLMLGPLKSIRPVPAESVAHSMLLDAEAISQDLRENGTQIIDSKKIFQMKL